jgi:hypothetical protein
VPFSFRDMTYCLRACRPSLPARSMVLAALPGSTSCAPHSINLLPELLVRARAPMDDKHGLFLRECSRRKAACRFCEECVPPSPSRRQSNTARLIAEIEFEGRSREEE